MTLSDKFLANQNGWRTFRGKKRDYRIATNNDGDCIIECDTGEAVVVDYDRWFFREKSIDEFWDENF